MCFLSVYIYIYKMHGSIPCSSIAHSSTCSHDSHDTVQVTIDIVDLRIEMRTETGRRKTVVANWLDCL